MIRCDLTIKEDIIKLKDFICSEGFSWTYLFSSVGTSEPIGRFFDLEFNVWKESLNINMTSQLNALHCLYPLRDTTKQVNVALLAGGGTNNPFRCYSSYALAKIGLIKMCELIDDENKDINIFIVGPGFVKTKTHLETLKAAEKAESNFIRVKEFMDSDAQGTSYQDIYDCIRWAGSVGRDTAGGRNFSVVHDKWGDEKLENELLHNKDMYKLRRFKNDWN